MTTLGKILVFGNLIMAVMLMAAGLALFGSQAIRTPPTAAEAASSAPSSAAAGNLHKKEFNERSKLVTDATDALQRIRRRWLEATQNLAEVEQAYASHPDFYKPELEVFADGPGNMKEVATLDGRLILDEKIHGRVTLVEAKNATGQPVQSEKVYQTMIADENAKLAALSLELTGDPAAPDPKKKAGLVLWHTDLTKKLYEKLPNDDPDERGLRPDLNTELTKIAQLTKELEFLDETRSKIDVDHEGMTRRFGQMTTRKKELQDKLTGKK
jgi:hypothetical protein